MRRDSNGHLLRYDAHSYARSTSAPCPFFNCRCCRGLHTQKSHQVPICNFLRHNVFRHNSSSPHSKQTYILLISLFLFISVSVSYSTCCGSCACNRSAGQSPHSRAGMLASKERFYLIIGILAVPIKSIRSHGIP